MKKRVVVAIAMLTAQLTYAQTQTSMSTAQTSDECPTIKFQLAKKLREMKFHENEILEERKFRNLPLESKTITENGKTVVIQVVPESVLSADGGRLVITKYILALKLRLNQKQCKP